MQKMKGKKKEKKTRFFKIWTYYSFEFHWRDYGQIYNKSRIMMGGAY